jgi:Fur family peroxide stress response transcriptional regulator
VKNDIVDELRAMGLKPTPQRLEVIKVLKERMEDHPSLAELFDVIKKRMPSISFSTLFNTVTTLEKSGYLTMFDLGGETRVELNLHNHVNIIDRSSGTVTDVDDEAMMKGIIGALGSDRVKDKRIMINVILY